MRANCLPNRVPLPLKLAYTVFVVLHVTVNWRFYGPIAFLWTCDVAVLTLLVAIWTESRLLVSIEALAVLVPLLLWGVDLAYRLAMGHGHYLLGFAAYMFDPRVPPAIRALSTFHLWLPILVAYLLLRLGYDRRALAIQCTVITLLLITCRLISDPQPATAAHPAVNLNWVYGPSDTAPQHVLPPALYVLMMIAVYQVVIYLPTHLLLSALAVPQNGAEPAKLSTPRRALAPAA